MKAKSINIISLFILLVNHTVSGQDSYGSQCILGRAVMVFENKYFVEYIAPFPWYEIRELTGPMRGSHIFYPKSDTVSKETTIIVKPLPDLKSQIDFDSILPDEDLFSHSTDIKEIEDFSLHHSIPAGRRFDIMGSEDEKVTSITYIKFEERIIAVEYTAPDKNRFIENLDVYEDFILSFRFSQRPG